MSDKNNANCVSNKTQRHQKSALVPVDLEIIAIVNGCDRKVIKNISASSYLSLQIQFFFYY